jgi:spore coat protein U-like protein
MKGALALAAIGAAVCFAMPARAACLACSCTVTAAPLSFGSFSPLGAAPVDAVGSLALNGNGLPTSLDSLTIELSTGAAGSFAPRRMRNGAQTLAYNLYSDPSRTIVWGDGAGGSSALVVQNQLSLLVWTTTKPVYARIPASPAAAPGIYADTIVVTVEW